MMEQLFDCGKAPTPFRTSTDEHRRENPVSDKNETVGEKMLDEWHVCH